MENASFLKRITTTNSDAATMVLRFLIGWTFFQAGVGKVFHAGSWVLPVSFFVDLGIPFPEAMFYVVGWTETIGGALLIFGLFTRVAALPLFIIIFTAIMIVHRISGYAYPLIICASCGILLQHGGGCYSIDSVISKRIK